MPVQGFGAITTAAVVVGAGPTTATTILAAGNLRGRVLLSNVGAATVYLGGIASGTGMVSTANGFPLNAGQTLELPNIGCALYGIVASGTNPVRVMTFSGGS